MYYMVSSLIYLIAPMVENLFLSLLKNKDGIEPRPYDYGCYYIFPLKFVLFPIDVTKRE